MKTTDSPNRGWFPPGLWAIRLLGSWFAALGLAALMAQEVNPGAAFVKVTTGAPAGDAGQSFGAAWGDYDNDGFLDLVVGNLNGEPNSLYRNKGNGTFEEIVVGPVAADGGTSAEAAWADYDNDGDLDLFVGNYGPQSYFYRNNGDGTFTRLTELAPVAELAHVQAAAWADYDNDGFVDLFLSNGGGAYNENNCLYHNKGDGTFTKVAAGSVGSDGGYSCGCAWADYDNDGDADLIVGNLHSASPFLYRNNGNGTFTRVISGPVAETRGDLDGIAWGDYDNDGWLDLFIANGGNQDNYLFHNDGNGAFTRITTGAAVNDGGYSQGCAWVDYDNDGNLDLFVANRLGRNFLYRNLGGGNFEKITTGPIVTDANDSNGGAWGDFNNDGFPDLFVVNWGGIGNCLYRNEGNANNWLKVKCVGIVSNRSGIGARVRIKTVVNGQELWQVREITSGSSWGGQPLLAHFGLGAAASVAVVRVEWPSGAVQEFTDVAAKQTLVVTEPARLLAIWPRGGEFNSTVQVTLKSTFPDGEARYTLDGSEPSATANLYGGPFTLSKTTTVKARVFVNGQAASDMVSATFTKLNLVVVPQGFAEVEDADGQAGILLAQPSARLQEVYSASHFPPYPILITEMRFRRDALQPPFSVNLQRIQFNLSTTKKTAGDLSATYAENLGPDDAVIFDGPLTASSLTPGPAGGPNPFEVSIPLTRSFLYNPAEGNLLVDVRNYTPANTGSFDASNESTDGAARAFGYDVNSSRAQYVDTGADIIQFIYSMEIPALLVFPPAGNYDRALDITMVSSVTDGIIRYSLDGSEPTVQSAAYSAPIKLLKTTTVKARVFVGGNPASDIVSTTYTIVLTAPTITAQPQNKTVTEGGSATFSVTATGSAPLLYQWTFNGNDVAGATSATLSLTQVTMEMAGNYAVKVSNEAGSVTSDTATLTVTPRPVAPKITKDPESQTVAVGDRVTFAVEATGTEPLSYRWYRNGLTVAGATTATLVLQNVQKTQAGTYTVRVSNSAGPVISKGAVLTVIDQPISPTITAAPGHQSVDAGVDVTLSVTTAGTPPLAYQWRFNGAIILDATNATLTLKAVPAAASGTYTVTVSNSAGAVTSDGAVVDVYGGEVGGTVNFANRVLAANIDAPVFDSDGVTRLAGPGFLAQLFAGPNAESLGPVGPAVPFKKASNAGYFNPGADSSRIIPTVVAGQPAAAQVRVWDASKGATYQEALAAGGKIGQSEVLLVVTGGAGEPASLPADLQGLKSFNIAPEAVPPVVTIGSPAADTTRDERVALSGTVTDNGTVASARWERDGVAQGPLALTDGQFTVGALRLHRGENRFKVLATDMAGNEADAEVVVTWAPSRVLAILDALEQQEGRLISLLLQLTSEGDAGGLTFVVRYDREQLKDPQLAWSETVVGAVSQVNYDTLGEIRATLSLPATVIPAGAQVIGELTFRARSVPEAVGGLVAVEVLDVADRFGNRLLFGTDVAPGAIRILPRSVKGDNNGNNRLDIGDATLIQRLIAGMDATRAWDITGNDLNQSQDLDSGDVIKVLRVVVGLDRQPGLNTLGQGGRVTKLDLASAGRVVALMGPVAGPSAVLVADELQAVPGEFVTVQIKLQDVTKPVFGAAFTLTYPVDALRLLDAQAHRAGPIVPANAAVLWNVAPAQNDYVAQSGQVSCAISSAAAWSSGNGVLAELTFQVQGGAGALPGWTLALGKAEITINSGYDIRALPAASLRLNPQPPRLLPNEVRLTGEGLQLSIQGEAGLSYVVEASSDLLRWQEVGALVSTNRNMVFVDAGALLYPKRFYRVKEVR